MLLSPFIISSSIGMIRSNSTLNNSIDGKFGVKVEVIDVNGNVCCKKNYDDVVINSEECKTALTRFRPAFGRKGYYEIHFTLEEK